MFVAVYREHSKETKAFYSLDNLHHLKLGNTATHLHNTCKLCKKTGWVRFHHSLTNLSALCLHWHYFTSPLSSCSATSLPGSHYTKHPWRAFRTQVLHGPVMPGQPWMKERSCPQGSTVPSEGAHSSSRAETLAEGQGPISGPRDSSIPWWANQEKGDGPKPTIAHSGWIGIPASSSSLHLCTPV